MVNSCYSIHSCMQAYGANIMPLRDHSEWQHVNGPTILPPSYEKKVGRPPKSRRKAPEEKAGGTRLSKHGVTIHCGYCRAPNHNRGGCPRLKAIAEAEARAQRHVQEQAHVNVQEQAHEKVNEPQPVARPRRKRRRTVHEQVSMPNFNRGPTTIDENGDADIPEILQHVDVVDLDPRLDPMNDTSSMISQLGRKAPQIQIEEDVPFPTESAFVAARRSSIPTARVTTATREGVAMLKGRGRNRSGRRRGAAAAAAASTAAASTSTTRGRGTRPAARGRGARGRGTWSAARGRGTGSTARGRGAGARVLFGDGHRQDNDAAQINNSQNATFDMSQ